MKRDLKIRFMEKVIVPADETQCWEWDGASRGVGYGCIKDADGKLRDSHRVAFELFNGPIPQGLLVMHTCDNRNCVNPAHLITGTHQDNQRDAISKGRVKPYRATRVEPLTDAEIAAIRDEHSRGVSQKQLCRKFNVSPTSLKSLVRLVETK